MTRSLAIILLVGTLGTGPATAQEVTFNKDVAPILWKNCAACHRPGDVGPFALLSYKDAAKRARHLKDVTASHRMPPWRAEPGWGDFRNERRLSAAEIALIARWADSGAKEGESPLPAPPTFAAETWRHGEPDAVFKMPKPFDVPATGGDVYRCFVIPANQAEDRWVSGVEFRAGNRKVVHHINCFVDTSGAARKLEGKDGQPGYKTFGSVGVVVSGWLGGWISGATPYLLPAGTGFKLPKGADLVLQIHYHPDGKPETDQSTVALHFAKEAVSRRVLAFPLRSMRINIPPGAKRHRLQDSLTFPADVQMIGIAPHMHLIGREMKVTATLPDGAVKPMVWIKDWDFNWQGFYTYRDKVVLPKGTRLDMEAFYDNSADNPQNPNSPPKRVGGGAASTDEMCKCNMLFVPTDVKNYPVLAEWMERTRSERKKQLKKAAVAERPPEPEASPGLEKRMRALDLRTEALDRRLDLLLRKLNAPDPGPSPGELK